MNTIEILTKAGYELHSFGGDTLPATLVLQGKPVGFLNADTSVSLTEENTRLRSGLESMIAYALDGQGLSVMGDEYIMTQYGQTVLTAGYDFDEQKPTYCIYSVDSEKNHTIVDSYEDKALAAQSFARISGLTTGVPLNTDREQNRINQFLEKLKNVGYQVRDALGDKTRKFEITDKNDRLVGYVGLNNRVSLITENTRERGRINGLFQSTNPAAVELPSFFQRLKESLEKIGLALKVMFTGVGRRYSIRSEHDEIATVNEAREVTYTPLASDAQKERINRLVAEIEQEKQQGMKSLLTPQAIEMAVAEQGGNVIFTDPAAEYPTNPAEAVPTIQDFVRVMSAVLQKPELFRQLESLVAQAAPAQEAPMQKAPEKKAVVQSALGKIRQAAQDSTKQEHPIQLDAPAEPLSPEQSAIVSEFNGYLEELNSLDGFNSADGLELTTRAAILADMNEKFGTTNQMEFLQNLKSGRYQQPKTLNEKLRDSKERIAARNGKMQNLPGQEEKQPEQEERK